MIRILGCRFLWIKRVCSDLISIPSSIQKEVTTSSESDLQQCRAAAAATKVEATAPANRWLSFALPVGFLGIRAWRSMTRHQRDAPTRAPPSQVDQSAFLIGLLTEGADPCSSLNRVDSSSANTGPVRRLLVGSNVQPCRCCCLRFVRWLRMGYVAGSVKQHSRGAIHANYGLEHLRA